MDKFSDRRITSGFVTPIQPTSTLHQGRVQPAIAPPDLILISLQEFSASEQPRLLAQAKYSGLRFESITLEETGDDSDLLRQIEALHINAKLAPGTQVVILMQGEIRDGMHWVGNKNRSVMHTVELINSLRCPPGSSKSGSQWKGVIHLISCHVAAFGEAMRDRLGYCVLYGGHERTLCEDGVVTLKEMMRVFGLSKQKEGGAINATSMFTHLAGFSGEPITLAGNGRCDFIHPFDAEPVTFDTEKSEIGRWMRMLFSSLDHGTPAEVKHILDIMGPQLANASYGGGRPLHFVACNGNDCAEKISVLLAAGADLDATDHHGRTPLAIACLAANSPAVASLLACGAKSLATDNEGVTPFERALAKGNKEIVYLLFNQFFEGVEEFEIDGFIALAKETSARSVVEKMIKALSE